MGLNMPGSDLENWAQRYLERFSYLELVELDDEDEEDWGWPSLGQGGPHRPNLREAGPGAVASAPEQHPNPPQEPTPAPTVWPAAPSGPEVTEPVPAAGGEGLAQAEMPAAEFKSMHMVLAPMIPHPDEEPPAPSATRWRSRPWRLQSGSPKCQGRHLPLEQLVLTPEQPPEPPQEPPQLLPQGS
nr:predicted GPI-anchored protein 58 [Vulpes vulpes]